MAHDQTQALSFWVASEPWGSDAKAWLARCVGHGRVTIDALLRQVANGADLFVIRDQATNQSCGAFILRTDEVDGGHEGVIVAAACEINGVDAIDVFLPDIERRFRSAGCLGVRFHSIRPGLMRKMLPHGYAPDEFVSYKAL